MADITAHDGAVRDPAAPGDYKQFYEDPCTRLDYLRWAPLLLAAENYVTAG